MQTSFQKYITSLNLKSCKGSIQFFDYQKGRNYFPCKEIVRVEADKSYSSFYLADGRKIIVAHNLRYYFKQLNPRFFYRIHRSHIINLAYINEVIEGNYAKVRMTDNSWVPVSRRKLRKFLESLSSKHKASIKK